MVIIIKKLKKMKNRYYIIFLLIIFTGCGDFLKNLHIKDKEFSMKTNPYKGTELKINGYYYKNIDNEYSRVFIFYESGVRYGGSVLHTSKEIENTLSASDFTKKYSDKREYWGPYEINYDKLKFEFYTNIGNMWCTCFAHCVILNDTTFTIEKITFSKTGEERKDGFKGEFHFKEFYPKPDSTNNFIK